MDPKLITKSNLQHLLKDLEQEYSVLVPVRKGETRFYQPLEAAPSFVVGEVRAFEPLKTFFFQAKQKVAENYQDTAPQGKAKPFCIVGAKACDLKGFKVLDSVFMGDDYLDPFYKQAREANLIISADCTSALETCFCLALKVDPYPKESVDLNLSEIGDQFVVEAGSEKGNSLLEKFSGYLQEAKQDQADRRRV